MTILYEDRNIDPHIPSDCQTFYSPDVTEATKARYFQQLWALNECFNLVKEYEQKMNIRYELLIQSRSDSVLVKIPDTLLPPNNAPIIIPNGNPLHGYNDRFAIGSMAVMEKYMRRWESLRTCQMQNIHAESFLKLLLNATGVNVQLEDNLALTQKKDGTGECH